MEFMGYILGECLDEVYGFYEISFVKFMRIRRKVHFWGLCSWSGKCIYKTYVVCASAHLWGENLYKVYRIYEERVFLSFMGFLRIVSLWGLSSLLGWCLYQENTFMRFMGFMRWVPLCGAWGLWCECPYEVSGVYLEISFLKVMGFMRGVPLRGLWGLSGEHLLWALWPFWGLWTLWYGVDWGSAFMMWNGLSTRVLLCGENLYEVLGFMRWAALRGLWPSWGKASLWFL